MERDLSLFEIIGGVTGLIGGAILGYDMGAEAVEYASTVANKELLSHMVNSYPSITQLSTTLGVSGTFLELGKLGGSLINWGYNLVKH